MALPVRRDGFNQPIAECMVDVAEELKKEGVKEAVAYMRAQSLRCLRKFWIPKQPVVAREEEDGLHVYWNAEEPAADVVLHLEGCTIRATVDPTLEPCKCRIERDGPSSEVVGLVLLSA